MLLRHSHIRLFLISNFVRQVSHPRFSPINSTTAAVFAPLPSTTTRSQSSTSSAMTFFMSSDPWNRLHDEMQLYHNHFRHTFNHIYERSGSVDSDDEEELNDLLVTGSGLYRHLDAHHSIEEAYIFPVLGERMPHFAKDGEHLKEHEEIHKGLDEFIAYIRKCRKDPKEWDGDKMRKILDSFRGILFKHLDHEVESLQGEELKKYWKLEELRRLPM